MSTTCTTSLPVVAHLLVWFRIGQFKTVKLYHAEEIPAIINHSFKVKDTVQHMTAQKVAVKYEDRYFVCKPVANGYTKTEVKEGSYLEYLKKQLG